ncbi:dynamin family protein [Lyngbya sp. PCC 8106]|uniref:dynamin family protein n=1 Tax=Lyngbya sp. (strain PCC 8106) TaxID=313612 RepID=UPI0000EA8F28|nr:dynamin family protein [Lyngbya sp. PCC 8106]EAW35078.1 hypothetical protein L8106_27369 [Lyngbya sp. PCC 8106]
MVNCPVCSKEYVEGTVNFCTACGWDLKAYPLILGGIPQEIVEKEQAKLKWAREKWAEKQQQNQHQQRLEDQIAIARSIANHNKQEKTMTSQAFQEVYFCLNDTGNRLLQYLRELRTGEQTQGSDRPELQSLENELQKALIALQEQRYQVAVIAAMKAGKSTFINAIIGADVLASESEACTVCRTDIRPVEPSQTPRLLEYRDGIKQPIVLASGDATVIKQKFLERTRNIRETQNPDDVIRFELEHPIEAIADIPCLKGFNLVDTPGPNEWESASFDTTILKRTALEALRNCDVILFVLDYSSFKDNTNEELLNILKERQEILRQSRDKVFFILNKTDRRAAGDRPLSNIIADLRHSLEGFGIPEPMIYPASSLQGLLAKLLIAKAATPEHKEDFKNFFLGRYAKEDEDGDYYYPKLSEAAKLSLEDSCIPVIEQSVIQTVVKSSGLNLLTDVLAKLQKAANAIEDTLNVEIQGWQTELANLKKKVEEYKTRSQTARNRVANVKQSVNNNTEQLVQKFLTEVDRFSEDTKKKIGQEIERVAEKKSSGKKSNDSSTGIFLLDLLKKGVESLFEANSPDPYKLRCKTRQEAEKIQKLINDYCGPVIQSWWLDTQDKLVREGESIRTKSASKIQKDVQAISNELSKFLGESLDIKINCNNIQFPKFEFAGIDAQVAHQQEVFMRSRKETRSEKQCCNSHKVYQVDVPYEETVSYYEIDLRLTRNLIHKKIDAQSQLTKGLLKRAIEQQVKDDFKIAERQIEDYINRFQAEFDRLLKQRETREAEAPEIIKELEAKKQQLKTYFEDVSTIQKQLNSL